MWTRRQFLSRTGLACWARPAPASRCLGTIGKAAMARNRPDGSASKGMITPQTDQAIDRGLAYLNAHANRDGSFGTGGYTGNVAVTSLAAMAFMAAGNLPNRGPYGRIVTNALKFVLHQEPRQRLIPAFCTTPALRRTDPCTATASPPSSWPKRPAWSTTRRCARKSTRNCTLRSS